MLPIKTMVYEGSPIFPGFSGFGTLAVVLIYAELSADFKKEIPKDNKKNLYE